ncbi:hypothetical protein SteCoe_29314 [Stentor coeruleus]|uniref:Cytidyltransferase-like domain-containing protein n=1 Tax=Stentor coeruleus TaxID=5963 RepID=A0A1R2B678_9CILI|nr:hypothetical protein SteCoe_29314 [Stentor coeruleus]
MSRTGFVCYNNVTSGNISDIITELLKYRYFITDELICEIESEYTDCLMQFASSIYLSAYSPLDPPIYVLIPQIFGTRYQPKPTDYIFSHDFLDSTVNKLKIEPVIEISLVNFSYTKKYTKAVMGGTFDHLHPGHLLFLTYAALQTEDLGIGMTHDNMLVKKNNKEFIQPWHIRKEKVHRFLTLLNPQIKLDIFEIFDPISKAGTEDYEGLILTTEVESASIMINNHRISQGLKVLEKSVINLAEIGQMKISSTNIRNALYEKSLGKYSDMKNYWENLTRNIGVDKTVSEKWWNFIASQYSRNCRAYHTLKHIYSIYSMLDNPSPYMELAAFFHDIIYFPLKHTSFLTNEELSKNFYVEFIKETGLAEDYFIVSSYILATIKHIPIVNSEEEKEFLDMDLSILGSCEKDYNIYADNIRVEYNWICDEDFKDGRAKVLQGFLKRDEIFYSQRFKNLENNARENIRNEIERLLMRKD